MSQNPAPAQPAQGDPEPGRWARFTARFRTTDRPANTQTTPHPQTAPPIPPITPTKVIRVAVEPPRPAPAAPSQAPPKPAAKQVAKTPPPRRPRSRWDMAAVVALAIGVLTIVVVGIRVGMGALRDSAIAAHIAPDAAHEYWIGVDGLIVVAIIAALVLRNVPGARRYCLGVVAFFTAASGLLQYLHGLGWFTPDRVTGVIKPLPWGVVLVIALLVIGTIFCGTHLFVHVLRCLFPGSAPDQEERLAAEPSGDREERDDQDETERPERAEDTVPLDADQEREVRKWFAAIAIGLLLDADVKPKRRLLATEFGISERQVGYVIADVERERESAAERKAQEQETAKAAKLALKILETPPPATAGSVNGAVPTSTGDQS